MKFGVHVDFRNPLEWRRPQNDVFSETLEFAAELDQMGVDYCWTGEHHFRTDGNIPNPLLAANTIASRTKRLRVGTFVLLLPLNNAIRVAEDATVVDIFSGGRLDLGLGLGYVQQEFDTFGVRQSERAKRMEEGLAVIRLLTSEGPASFHGTYYDFDSVELGLRTVQKPFPIWVGARSVAAAQRAGRFAANVLLERGAHDNYNAYVGALAQSSYSGVLPSVQMFMGSVIATKEDPRTVWRRIEPHQRYMDTFLERTDALWRSNQRHAPIIGPPDHCTERILQELKGLPVTHLHFYQAIVGIPYSESLPWIELFMSEVAPMIEGELGQARV